MLSVCRAQIQQWPKKNNRQKSSCRGCFFCVFFSHWVSINLYIHKKFYRLELWYAWLRILSPWTLVAIWNDLWFSFDIIIVGSESISDELPTNMSCSWVGARISVYIQSMIHMKICQQLGNMGFTIIDWILLQKLH